MVGGHAAEVEGLLDMVGVAPPAGIAGGLLHAVGQHGGALPRVETQQRRRRGNRAEQPAHAVRAVVLVEEAFAAQGAGDARPDVVAHGHGAQERGTARADPVGHGQRRRHHGTAGMGQRGGVGVVRLVGMGHHAIGQRCHRHGRTVAVADHDGVAAPALQADPVQRPLARRQAGARHDGGHRVQHMHGGLVQHLGWQRARLRAGDVGREQLGDRHHHRNTPPLTCTVWPVT